MKENESNESEDRITSKQDVVEDYEDFSEQCGTSNNTLVELEDEYLTQEDIKEFNAKWEKEIVDLTARQEARNKNSSEV